MTIGTMIIILNCTMLLTSTAMTALQSIMIYKEMKKHAD